MDHTKGTKGTCVSSRFGDTIGNVIFVRIRVRTRVPWYHGGTTASYLLVLQ